MNKLQKFFSLIFSTMFILNSCVYAKYITIRDIIKEASQDIENTEDDYERVVELIRKCAYKLQKFVEHEEYKSGADISLLMNDKIIAPDKNNHPYVWDSTAGTWIYFDNLNYCPGFSPLFMSLTYYQIVNVVNPISQRNGGIPQLWLLEHQLNYILNQKEKRVNTLILAACMYCGALILGGSAAIVHTNLGENPDKFDPTNSKTSVIICCKNEGQSKICKTDIYNHFLVTFYSDKRVTMVSDYDDLQRVHFDIGSRVYYKSEVDRLGLICKFYLTEPFSLPRLTRTLSEQN